MKILKKILIGLLIIIAIPLVVALFVKKEYTVEREVTINKPSSEVFDYVKHINNQAHYNKWVMMDPNLKKETRGTDGTVGFALAWDSDKVGKGEQEITQISEGKRLDLALHFIKPYENNATAYMTTDALSENQTKLKWGMVGRSPYPMNFMNLFMNSLLGRDLETSLTTLKGVLER